MKRRILNICLFISLLGLSLHGYGEDYYKYDNVLDRLIKGEKASKSVEAMNEKIENIEKPFQKKKISFVYPLNNYGEIKKRPASHRALDIAVPKGTYVIASCDGTVSFSGWKRGYGNVIFIEHDDGYQTRYAHLQVLNVKNGDDVKSGQKIGTVGMTGWTTGPHLHFEIRKNFGSMSFDANAIANYISVIY